MSARLPRKKEQGERYDPSGVVITYRGQTRSLREWSLSRQCKVSQKTLRTRITKGWPLNLAFTTPEGVLLEDARKKQSKEHKEYRKNLYEKHMAQHAENSHRPE
ncbi:MAG TPA: hypothetical protein VD999_07735 [Vitreimonas sp.]|nr:hypothetical protein [Vitreimonas sp.]